MLIYGYFKRKLDIAKYVFYCLITMVVESTSNILFCGSDISTEKEAKDAEDAEESEEILY